MSEERRNSDLSHVLSTIETFADDVEAKFKGLLLSLSDLKSDLKQISHLKELVYAAESMLEGQVEHTVDSELKGEVGRLFKAINETQKKLQQLDQSVHQESEKVPELAAHLDQITRETETATQQVLEKLDAMLETSDQQAESIERLRTESLERLESDQKHYSEISSFFEKLLQETDRDQTMQEAMDFIALEASEAKKKLSNSESVRQAMDELSRRSAELQDHTFDIMNLLQFQDITRQKISKVIGLLKELQTGMNNLLNIFNMKNEDMETLQLSEHHKATQDKILDRKTNVDGKEAVDVDAIIASFQAEN
ncbi:MAG: hypothetical protein CSA81_05845 [Acidobacteria bacterium]|nr:MAG: hypothetical protein CSA81_05845 [Acidobacteriota bacterium]